MRTAFCSLWLIFIFSMPVLSGQDLKDIRYRDVKSAYSSSRYSHQSDDPLNPGIVSVSSIIVPGLGQIISGEPGRGLGFMGGTAACLGVSLGGILMALKYDMEDEVHDDEVNYGLMIAGIGICVAGLIGAVVVDIGSAIDAGEVARVKNLAWRDRNKTSKIIKLEPYLKSKEFPGNRQTAAGVSVMVTF